LQERVGPASAGYPGHAKPSHHEAALAIVLSGPTRIPEKAARKLVEIANSVEAVQDGRIYIELMGCRPPEFGSVSNSDPIKEKSLMTTSMLDQRLFNLSCGHAVVLGRLEKQKLWTCDCGKKTDLTQEPYKSDLAHELDTATQMDLQAKQKGETVTRSG
jgi:hypothetical protein